MHLRDFALAACAFTAVAFLVLAISVPAGSWLQLASVTGTFIFAVLVAAITSGYDEEIDHAFDVDDE